MACGGKGSALGHQSATENPQAHKLSAVLVHVIGGKVRNPKERGELGSGVGARAVEECVSSPTKLAQKGEEISI